MSHIINSHALTGEKPCINKAIHAVLMHGYATFNTTGPQICCHYEMCTARPRMSIVCGNSVHATLGKRRNKIVQEITQNVVNVFSFYAIIVIKHGFQYINIRQVPWEVLKTVAFGLSFQHLPQDLANVNALKNRFDPYNMKLPVCMLSHLEVLGLWLFCGCLYAIRYIFA